MPSRTLSAAKLENHLTLHAWLNHQFGYKTTRDLLDALKTEEEGFRPDGRSAICEALMSNARPTVAEQLLTYDANIRRHLGVINRPRTQPIVLRYFQYLALLYTEIYYKSFTPALDADGRCGRLLIILQLIEGGLPNKPMLYMSTSFERRRESYIPLD